jgi:hypothetical protein
MSKLTLTLEFDSFAAFSAFSAKFAPAPAAVPTVTVTESITAPLPTAPTTALATPTATAAALTATAAAPTGDDAIKATQQAMASMVGRTPDGAVKAKAILAQHGLARVRDVRPEAAQALINAFNTAV